MSKQKQRAKQKQGAMARTKLAKQPPRQKKSNPIAASSVITPSRGMQMRQGDMATVVMQPLAAVHKSYKSPKPHANRAQRPEAMPRHKPGPSTNARLRRLAQAHYAALQKKKMRAAFFTFLTVMFCLAGGMFAAVHLSDVAASRLKALVTTVDYRSWLSDEQIQEGQNQAQLAANRRHMIKENAKKNPAERSAAQ